MENVNASPVSLRLFDTGGGDYDVANTLANSNLFGLRCFDRIAEINCYPLQMADYREGKQT